MIVEKRRISPQSLTPMDGHDDGYRQGVHAEVSGDGMAAGGDVEHAEIEMELEYQAVAPRIARSQKEPTSRERTLNEVMHLPFRNGSISHNGPFEIRQARRVGGGRRRSAHLYGLHARVRAGQ